MKPVNRSSYNRITKPTIGGRQLVIRMVTFAGLLVSMALTLRPNPALLASSAGLPAPQSLNTWSSHGPWGGYVTTLAIAPSNPDILYAWTEDDVFKSTNGGANWNHVGRFADSAAQVAIDTFNSEILYVRPNVFPSPAYKTTDGGASWSPMGAADSPVKFLAMDPANPTTLYVLDGKFRLSKSTDGGATWSRTGNGLPEHSGSGDVFPVLAVSPGNTQTLYATYPVKNAENQNLYRSTDGGANWSRVYVGPFGEVPIAKLAVARSSPNVLYAGTYRGVFRSTDGGANWSATGLTDVSKNNVNILSLALDPENASVVYAAVPEGRVLTSGDGGTTWSEAKVGLYGAPVLALVIDPRDTTTLYAGTGSGVFKSGDGGKGWQEASSGLGAGIHVLAALGGGVLFANSDWSSVFRSADTGENWGRANLPGPAYLVTTDPNHPNLIYAYANTHDFLYKSTDAGASWSTIPVDASLRFWFLAIGPGNPATLYASRQLDGGDAGIIKSTDSGTSWRAVGKSLTTTYDLTFDPANSKTIYALSSFYDEGACFDSCSTVYKSTDDGLNWYQNNFGLPQSVWITALALDSYDPNTLYALLYDRRVFKTTDGAATWKATGLTPALNLSTGYNSLVIDPADSETLYVGHGSVVYRSTDGGATWTGLTHGLPDDLEIRALAIDPSGTSLHVGTNRGVFNYHLATPCAEPLSPANQSFEAGGGTGFVEVTAPTECGWMVESFADWIRLTSASSGAGKGTVSYSILPNESTAPRIGRMTIAGRVLKVTQAGAIVRINNATVSGKKLFIVGENFDPGAVILINGEPQLTKNDPQNPKTSLIGKKAGKKIRPGGKLQVRNPNGSLSQELVFIGP